jgi:hypothetical protein
MVLQLATAPVDIRCAAQELMRVWSYKPANLGVMTRIRAKTMTREMRPPKTTRISISGLHFSDDSRKIPHFCVLST